MLKKINFLFISVGVLVLLILIHLLNFRKYYTSDSSDFDSALFEPSLNIALGLITTSVLLMFFKQVFFDKWLKRIFVWFLPLSLVIIFTTDVYGGIPQPSRTDTAALLSMLLVAITLIFILIQKFYFKVK